MLCCFHLRSFRLLRMPAAWPGALLRPGRAGHTCAPSRPRAFTRAGLPATSYSSIKSVFMLMQRYNKLPEKQYKSQYAAANFFFISKINLAMEKAMLGISIRHRIRK